MKRIDKKRLFDIIQIGQTGDIPSKLFDLFIVSTILLNILALILLTFEPLSPYFPVLRAVEWVTTLIFCVEYFARIWTAEYLYGEKGIKSVVRFMLSFDGLIDLFTILPLFFLGGFIAFRFLRVARIFHLFRINSAYDSFNVITSVIYEKRNQLISSLFIIWVLIIASSLCMYNAEHAAQPEVFKNALSGIWYSVATIFTVGYGDVYPVTIAGKIMGMCITFLGVGAVAIPTGIISAGFVEQYTRLQGDNNAGKLTGIKIEGDNEYKGKQVGSLPVNVVLIVRDGEAIVPLETTTVKYNDVIVCR
ncbi:MAG: ion transporter [Lachnospiraceae bacterium]|nr:ion transporter [Lachnospiraceae bacterium]